MKVVNQMAGFNRTAHTNRRTDGQRLPSALSPCYVVDKYWDEGHQKVNKRDNIKIQRKFSPFSTADPLPPSIFTDGFLSGHIGEIPYRSYWGSFDYIFLKYDSPEIIIKQKRALFTCSSLNKWMGRHGFWTVTIINIDKHSIYKPYPPSLYMYMHLEMGSENCFGYLEMRTSNLKNLCGT